MIQADLLPPIVLLCIGIAALLGYLLYQSNQRLGRIRHELEASKLTLASLSSEKKALTEQIDRLTVQRDTLDTQRTEARLTTQHLETQTISFSERLAELTDIKIALTDQVHAQQQTILDLHTQLSKLNSENRHLREQKAAQDDAHQRQLEEAINTFKSTAQRLFDEKSDRLTSQNKQQIDLLLQPLKENIEAFKIQVSTVYDQESKQRFALEEKIKELASLNQQISLDAQQLTNALKGQAKTQGDWGEMILERILEHAGLRNGYEYTAQTSYQGPEGQRLRPDIIIRYPDERYVIIDAKVILTAYERFANSEDVDTQRLALKAHVQAVRRHIDDLSSKRYDQFAKGLDFVFLFIPIEPAFLTALQHDDQLWQYAYAQRIILMSPTNLMATLRLIKDIWHRDRQHKNVEKIAERGAALYDKFVGFITDMQDIEKQLQKATTSYGQAMKKLKTGQGSLVRQTEMLRELGAKPKKPIPQKLLERTDD